MKRGNMPVVNGKHFPYTQKGKAMAKKAKKKVKKVAKKAKKKLYSFDK
jgi:hypothetical protein